MQYAKRDTSEQGYPALHILLVSSTLLFVRLLHIDCWQPGINGYDGSANNRKGVLFLVLNLP